VRPEWQDTGTANAAKCGHPYPIQSAINDRGEAVTRHDAYPDPDAQTFAYDALDLCHACYVARMERRPMSFEQMNEAWRRPTAGRTSTVRR
jgi:hypothetical protein